MDTEQMKADFPLGTLVSVLRKGWDGEYRVAGYESKDGELFIRVQKEGPGGPSYGNFYPHSIVKVLQPALCPVCETSPCGDDDYLCGICRYGC